MGLNGYSIMKKRLLLWNLYLFLSSICSFSQNSLPGFADYNPEEISLKECSFDRDADAVILLDEAVTSYDDDYHMLTTRRIRIKILKERAVDRGNIRIRYYSKDDFEAIRNVSALSYNASGTGNPLISWVDKKSIFSEKEDRIYSSIRFAIPNVKVGSILEYKFESIMKNFGGLQEWVFQSDLPTYRSCYQLEVVPVGEFTYQVLKSPSYPIIIQSQDSRGMVYFEMKYIPGLRNEPFMDAAKDYLQRVEFQLSAYVSSFGGKTRVNQTWRDLAIELCSGKEFLGAFRKDYAGLDELQLLVGGRNTGAEKLNVIYEYVKKRFAWNNYYGIYASDGLKNVWEKRTGSAGEINLLLVNLLQHFDIEAYPLLVAERDYGKVDTAYPFVDRFNKTCAYAVADGKTYILDASQKYNIAGLIPYPLLNTYAFLVDRKKFSLFKIRSRDEKYDNFIVTRARLSDKAVLTGGARIQSFQYARQIRAEEIATDEKKFIKKNFMDPHEGVAIDSFHFQVPDNSSEPLVQDIYFHNDLVENGGFVLLNYNLFSGISRNPFTSDIRFTNINFGYPYSIILEEEIEVPSTGTTDELPKNKKLVTPQRDISLAREISRVGNVLKIRISFTQTNTLYEENSYPMLKQFYKLMVDMLNEPVVVKLGK